MYDQLLPPFMDRWKYDWLFAVLGTPDGSQTVMRLGSIGLRAMLVSRWAWFRLTRTGAPHVVSEASSDP